MDLSKVRKLYCNGAVKWTVHCLERMQERDISRADVSNCIMNGEVIEDYPDSFPNQSCLIFGYNMCDEVIHVVLGMDESKVYIVTAYFPNMIAFKEDMKTRRL